MHFSIMLTSNNTFIISKIIRLRVLAFFKVLFAFLFINTAFSLSASAQRDVIITQAKEEIRCRILDETPTRFIYAYVGPKGDILRNEIFKNLVRDFQYNKYENDLPLAKTKKGKSKKNKKSKDIALAKNDVTSSDSPEKTAIKRKKGTEEKVISKTSGQTGKSKKELRKEEKAIEEQEKEASEISRKETKKAKAEGRDADKLEKELKKAKPEIVLESTQEPKKIVEEEITVESKTPNSKEKGLNAEVASESYQEPEKKGKEEIIAKVETPTSVEKDLKTKRVLEESKQPLKKGEGETIVDSKKTNKQDLTKEEVDSEVLKEESEEIKQVVDSELAETAQEKPIIENESALTQNGEVILDEGSLVETSKESTPIVGGTSVETTGEFNNYLKWRIGVKAGIGNILNNDFEASNAYGLYQEKLLKGYTFGADLAFFPMEGFGLGVVYTDFRSSNSNDNLTYINQATGEEMTGSTSDKISRKFIGPAFFLRKGIDFKTFVVLGVSPGMYFYSDKGDYNEANFNYTGKEFGGAATLGLDFLLGNDIIGRDIILSLEAGYNMGKINDINYNDGTGMLTLDSPIIMDRLDFSIGLRFMRFPKYLKK